MNTAIYNHRSGISVVPTDVLDEIITAIETLSPKIIKNSVTGIKDAIKELLIRDGWSGEYRLDASSRITISSYKKGIGLCLQTGNVGRIYADLLKLQTLYLKGNISAGLIIVPQQETAVKLASNMANYERLIREMPIFNQVISMPIVVVGFNVER